MTKVGLVEYSMTRIHSKEKKGENITRGNMYRLGVNRPLTY